MTEMMVIQNALNGDKSSKYMNPAVATTSKSAIMPIKKMTRLYRLSKSIHRLYKPATPVQKFFYLYSFGWSVVNLCFFVHRRKSACLPITLAMHADCL